MAAQRNGGIAGILRMGGWMAAVLAVGLFAGVLSVPAGAADQPAAVAAAQGSAQPQASSQLAPMQPATWSDTKDPNAACGTWLTADPPTTAGAYQAIVTLSGAGGGMAQSTTDTDDPNATTPVAGSGSEVQTTISAVDGPISVEVGCGGKNETGGGGGPGGAGFGTGGSGGKSSTVFNHGGAGGGGSALCLGTVTSGTGCTTPLVVAGGGGGTGGGFACQQADGYGGDGADGAKRSTTTTVTGMTVSNGGNGKAGQYLPFNETHETKNYNHLSKGTATGGNGGTSSGAGSGGSGYDGQDGTRGSGATGGGGSSGGGGFAKAAGAGGGGGGGGYSGGGGGGGDSCDEVTTFGLAAAGGGGGGGASAVKTSYASGTSWSTGASGGDSGSCTFGGKSYGSSSSAGCPGWVSVEWRPLFPVIVSFHGAATMPYTAVSPDTGIYTGGTSVTVSGYNLTAVTAVRFGSDPASTFHSTSVNQFTVTTPAYPTFNVTVDTVATNKYGTSIAVKTDQFHYLSPPPTITSMTPKSGPVTGGTTVTLTGTYLAPVAGEISFLGIRVPQTDIVSDSLTKLVFRTPSLSVGSYQVTVTTFYQGTPASPTFTFTANYYNWAGVTTGLEGAGGYSVSCPSSALCDVGSNGGAATVTDPASDPAWQLGGVATGKVSGISCPTTTECVLVDSSGYIAQGNPTNAPASWFARKPGGSTPLVAISCPVANFCAAVDGAGHLLLSTQTYKPVDIDGSTPLTAISCTSATFCLATDAHGKVLVSNDPAGGARSWITYYPVNGPALTSASCVAAYVTWCAVGTSTGFVLTTHFSAGSTTPTRWVTSQPFSGSAVTGLSCDFPNQSLICTAVDGAGATATGFAAENFGQGWALNDVDGATPMSAVSCVSGGICLAVDDQGHAFVGTLVAPATLGGTQASTGRSAPYLLATSNGDVLPFGGAQDYGSMADQTLNAPVVGMAATPTGGGYWLVAADGGVFSFGTATFDGSMGGQHLNAPIVGIAATPTGQGYWEVAADGGIFAFGTATFYGSMGGKPLNQPIVGIAATPTGGGYWEVAADGGIFSFGTAQFYGSMGGQHLNAPIVGIAATPTGGGYWLVAADGGIFSFGSAQFYGSMGGQSLNKPIVGISATSDGAGYWEVASDGGIFAFGDASFEGSVSGQPLSAPVVAVAATAV